MELWHEVWIDAPTDDVFAALTTKEGIDGWWGPTVSAEPRVGAVVELDHQLGDLLRMEIVELVPNERVVWKCVSTFTDPSNPASEWSGQVLSFELAPRRDVELLGNAHRVTVLTFHNSGWPADSRWGGFCNAAWGQTLGGKLKPFCESIAGARSPEPS
jgi:uncharacterized protein YndB with AHSA1/START domain